MFICTQFAAKMIPQAQASGVNGSDGMNICIPSVSTDTFVQRHHWALLDPYSCVPWSPLVSRSQTLTRGERIW